MKWKILWSLSALAAAPASVDALHAQAEGGAPAVESAVPAVASGEGVVVMSASELRRRLTIAERHLERGNLPRARMQYASLAEDLRAQDVLPSEAMWRLAAVHYAEGNPRLAAATLDELADAAATYRVPALQAAALVEAARLYQREGAVDASVARLSKVVELLSSPTMSDDTRVSLLKRIGR